MGDKANGANFLTIVGGHIIDTLTYCVAPFAEFSSTVTTQFPHWRLTDSGETIKVDAPDSVVIEGQLVGGAALSLHAASVPHNASGWRMEIYGTDATIVATTSGLPQITPIELQGAHGAGSLETLSPPSEFSDQMPPGPAGNVGRAYQGLAARLSRGQSFTPDFAYAESLHHLLNSL
jgi:predicted dehydrogenase